MKIFDLKIFPVVQSELVDLKIERILNEGEVRNIEREVVNGIISGVTGRSVFEKEGGARKVEPVAKKLPLTRFLPGCCQ